MNSRISRALPPILLLLSLLSAAFASSPDPQKSFPRLVKFSASIADAQGKPVTGTVGVTFAIYSQQTGGSPIWIETQNIPLDAAGHYSVLLGAASAEGLPSDLFNTGEARWLGVQAQLPGEPEQARVLLVSVPYAMKAGDANTLGGLPASSFLQSRNPQSKFAPERNQNIGNGGGDSPGSVNYVPKFDSGSSIINSNIFDNGTTVGIGTSTPSALVRLEVNGDIKADNIMYNAVDNLFDKGSQTLDCGDGEGSHTVHVSGKFTTFGGGGWDGFRGETNHPCGNAMEGVGTSPFGPVYGVYGQTLSNTGSGVVGESNDTTGTGVSYGVQGWIDGPKGVAVLALQNDGGDFPPAALGDLIAIEGLVNHANSIAAVFDNTAGGPLISGRENGTENFSVQSNGNVTSAGTITANVFSGSGASLTDIPGAAVTGSISGTATALSANGTNCSSGSFAAGVDAAGNAEGCSADGSLLTSLNASQISTGTLPDSRLSGAYSAALTLANPANIFAGVSASLTAAGAGAAVAGNNAGNAAGANGVFGTTQSNVFPSYGVFGLATQINGVGGGFRNSAGDSLAALVVRNAADNVVTFQVTSGGNIIGNGAGLSNLNAGNLFGTVASARISGTYSNALTFSSAANSFTGNGSGLTALNAGQLSAGTVPSARLSGTYGSALDLSNASNTISGTFTGNGAALTNLNATQVTSGTLPSAQLGGTYSSAITFSNSGNAYAGSIATINGPVSAGTQLNQGAANRWAGTLAIAADTTGSVTFSSPYVAAPVCTVSPTEDPGLTVRWWVTTTSTAITVNASSIVTLGFNYICVGNPN